MIATRQEIELARTAALLFTSRTNQTVSEWCEQNIWLSAKLTPMPGPFRLANTPYLERPLNCFGDTGLSDLAFCMGTQVAKTTLIMLGMAWCIKNDPGNTLWLLPTERVARSFNRRRWHPFIKSNEVMRIEMPADSDFFTLLEQHFLLCFIKFAGSHSIAELIESPVRRVVDDEIDAYPEEDDERASSADLADERTKAFRNAFRIKASSPTKDPSAIWAALNKGTYERYAVRCPECEHRFFMDWRDKDGGYFVKWDPRGNLSNGTYDLACVRETAHYECPKCKKKLNDSDKILMLRKSHGAEWLATNLNPSPRFASFQLGSIYSPWVTFGSMAEKWIETSKSILGLRIFINGWLGEVFKQTESEEIEFPESDYSMCQVLPAENGFTIHNPDPWALETHRLMTIDKQEGRTINGVKDTPHLKVLVKAYHFTTGAQRVLYYGRLPNEEEARALQIAFGIQNAATCMDHGYEGTEVARICAKYGWTALKGDDREYFLHHRPAQPGQPAGMTSVRKPYAPRSKVDAYVGTANQGRKIIRLHLWSNPTIKDALQVFMSGKGPEWKLPRDIPEDYLSEIRAEHRRKKFMPQTGKEVWQWIRVKGSDGKPLPNEALDLECMQIVAALLCKIKFAALAPAVEKIAGVDIEESLAG